ncbi:hypothetical protein QAD02_007923 [Eretmocerus hayati]|uniref:Uncharacterized protein n=1 Tax=Eretmocerus hayati TaxID=131215 RepID=A0ACC2N5B0_9HYME|nr:hypothetical protein QAD02_007923 [Eretmocerus hayati]
MAEEQEKRELEDQKNGNKKDIVKKASRTGAEEYGAEKTKEEIILEALISQLRKKPTIIACSETWLHENKDLYKIPDYEIIINQTKFNKADGVAMYVREKIDIDSIISVELEAIGGKRVVISTIYRSHDYPKEKFIKDMQDFTDFEKDLKNHIIIGDFNINILENDKYSNELLNNFYEMAYEPYFSKDTRISSNLSDGTCIDNAFIKTNLDIESYRIDQPFTDHYPLLLRVSQPIQTGRINHNTRNRINYK